MPKEIWKYIKGVVFYFNNDYLAKEAAKVINKLGYGPVNATDDKVYIVYRQEVRVYFKIHKHMWRNILRDYNIKVDDIQALVEPYY